MFIGVINGLEVLTLVQVKLVYFKSNGLSTTSNKFALYFNTLESPNSALKISFQ